VLWPTSSWGASTWLAPRKGAKGGTEATAVKITRDTKIEELMRSHPEALEVFDKYDMQCSDCIALGAETVEGGARMHGVDVDQFLNDLNAVCKE